MNVQPWQKALADSNRRQLMAIIQSTDSQVQQAMLQSLKDIDRQISHIGGTGIGASVRRAQYMAQRAAIGENLETLWQEDLDTSMRNGIHEATDLAVQSNKAMFGFLANAAPGAEQDLARSLYASQLGTWRNLQSRIINNVPLSSNVYKNQAFMSGKIDSIVNSSLLAGDSAKELADKVEQYINPKVMGGARYSATRLGRTEINNAAHRTSIETYKASPYVQGVQWFLSGSHPRPDQCNSYADDNNFDMGSGIYPPTEVPDKPHPQCFCFIAPITITPKQFVQNMNNGVYDEEMNNLGFAQAAMCH